MKKVILFEAHDGKQFTSEDQCAEYEANGCVEFYTLPGYGEHVTLTEQQLNWMIGGDGSCYYATASKMTRIRPHKAPHPSWATHLIYFGK
jgi:hypothetical protein